MLMVFENKDVEVFEWEGKVLFNPRHVGTCLGISPEGVRKAITTMNERQVIKLKNSDVTNSNIRKLNNAGENFLTESGVYKLIFKSRKEEAERFQDWVTDEVLPQIRKTGGYIPVNENDDDMTIMAKALKIANRTIEEKDKIIEEKDKIIEEKDRVIGEMDIKIEEQDIEIGELKETKYKLEGLSIKGYSLRDLSTCLGLKERFLDDYCISQGWYSRVNHDVVIYSKCYARRVKKNSINFTELGREKLIEKFRDRTKKIF